MHPFGNGPQHRQKGRYNATAVPAGWIRFIAEHGELGAALLDHCDDDLDEAGKALTDAYLGAHASLADYVQDVTEEATAIPSALRYYINWQAMARDAEISGDLFTV